VQTVTVQGRDALAVVDTCSEVTTVTQSWFGRNFPEHTLKDVRWLQLKASNGLEIPYVGIAELNVTLLGWTCERTLMLVVEDSVDATTRKRKERCPMLLGMNVIGKFAEHLNQTAQNEPLPAWLLPVVREVRTQGTSFRGHARVAGQEEVLVSAESLITLHITGTQSERPLLAERAPTGLPASLMVVPTLVS